VRPAAAIAATARAAAARGTALAESVLASAANRSFSSRLIADAGGPIVLLSPHVDDAVLSCWSVLTRPEPVQPVNVFAAPPPSGFVTRYDRICGATDSAQHVRARLEEDMEALRAAGRSPLNLPFLDRQYRRPWQTPSLRQLDDALADRVPRARALYAPAGLGFAPQPDHALVRTYALAAARNRIPLWLYADVPYAVTFGWPSWVTESEPDAHLDVDAYWEHVVDEIAGFGALRGAHVARLASEDAARKLAAMQAYRTQFRALDGGAIGLLRNPLVHPFEVFWEAKTVT